MLLHTTAATAIPPQIDAFEDAEREERCASALTFLRGLFEPTDTICLWFIHQETKKQDWSILPLDQITTEMLEQLDQKQADKWNIYVCMNPLKPGSDRRLKENVSDIRTAYLDIDKDGPAQRVELEEAVEAGEVPAPRFVVSSSPKKYHISWRLNGATKQQQEQLLDKLITRFGGDTAASDCNRVLRLPGFTNLKYETKPVVLILEQNDGSATLDQFKIGASTVGIDDDFEPYAMPAPGTKITENRNNACASFAMHEWYNDCPSEEELRERVYLFNDTFCQPPLEKSELDATVLSSTPKKQQRKDLYITFDGYRGGESPYLQQQATETVTAAASPTGLKFNFPAVTGGIFDFVIEPLGFSSEGWFPLGSPSLIAGSSGGAKTTWAMDLLLKQAKKEPFLGHSTNGRPFLVLMADRGEASHERTMRRMKMENESIPIKFFTPKYGLPMWQEIIDLIEEENPLPQVVFIEGADLLVEDDIKKQLVSQFMTALQKIAEHYHIAIMGSVGSPKSKAGQGYVAKRDNVTGTGAWSRLAETIVVMQYPEGNDMADKRQVSVLLRNGPSESFSMVFRDGRLVPQEEEKRSKDPKLDWVQLQYVLSQSDPTKRWWTRLDMDNGLDQSKSTSNDWISDAYTKKWITKKPGEKTRGNRLAEEYQWNTSETNPLKPI